ncbi:MAG: hypothetical protein ABSD56_00805 [Bryobacteraceae bacterium]
MGVLKAKSDLKFMREFAAIVPFYVNAFNDVERLVYEGTMTGPNMYGELHPECVSKLEKAQTDYCAARELLNSMINRASQITRARGIMSPFHALLVAPADYERLLWRGSALPRNERLEIKDALDQTLPACKEHLKAEIRNFFNPFHHLANLIRLILHPLASLLGKHFETLIKVVTPAASLALIIWVLRLLGINFDLRDILPLLKH